MTTFDEALPAAMQMLSERGLLLNAQLLRLVDGDESLFQEVRESLIFNGLAEDRFGVGLARLHNPGAQSVSARPRSAARSVTTMDADDVYFAAAPEDLLSANEPRDSSSTPTEPESPEWWLMAAGVTRGPFEFSALRLLRRRGEMTGTDLVRRGQRGLWQSPAEVEGLSDVSDVPISEPVQSMPPTTPSRERPRTEERMTAAAPPAREVAIAKESPRHASDEGVEYFLWEAGLPVGPISRGELQSRLDAGRIEADEFVQVGRDGDWQPVTRALGAPRPPLRLPMRAASLSDAELDAESEDDAPQTPAPLNKVRRGEPSHNEGVSRAVVSKHKVAAATKALSDAGSSPIVRVWKEAATLVGGERRLGTILFSVAAVVALIVWWRQPPSAAAVYREFAACHAKLKDLRARRAGPTDWSLALSRERSRFPALLEGLQQRAGAARPADQELLWAGQHGLRGLLDNPADASEFERLFANHMARAQRLIDPQATPAWGTASPPAIINPVTVDGSPGRATPNVAPLEAPR